MLDTCMVAFKAADPTDRTQAYWPAKDKHSIRKEMSDVMRAYDEQK